MKKITNKIFLIMFIITIFFQKAISQDSINKGYAIKIIARSFGDSIKLRWAPIDYQVWRHCIKHGYIIERITLIRDGDFLDKREKKILTSKPLKPYPLDEWEKYVEKDDFVGIAAQATYGKDFNVKQINTSPIITVFNLSSEQQNRYSFAMFSADCSPIAAKLSALSFTDYYVKKNEKYLYRIYPSVDLPFYMDTAVVMISADDNYPFPKPFIKILENDEKNVLLEWPSDEDKRIYTAYEVFRSDDDGKVFHNLTEKPFVGLMNEYRKSNTIVYVDTIREYNKKYVYKIRGISPFGERSPFSDTVSIYTREKAKAILYIIRKEFTDEGLLLEWEFDRKYDNLIKHFIVMRSINSIDGYIEISEKLNSSIRMYIDKNPLPTAYYRVVAIDKENRSITSFPLLAQMPDTIPPHVPEFIEAKMDSFGKVYLKWKKNKDFDIYGYRIYRANDVNEEFSLITRAPIIDTFYVDTVNLKTLSPAVYYKLIAIDNRQNISEFSYPLRIKRIDTIPPAAVSILDYNANDTGICIKWTPCTSVDLKEYKILRKEDNTNEWKVIKIIKDKSTEFCDKSVERNKKYRYNIVAVDSSELESAMMNDVVIRSVDDNIKLELICKIDKENRTIKLTWNNIENAQYHIYRSEGHEPMILYMRVNTNKFDDIQVIPDMQYKYMVKALLTNKIIISNVEEIYY